MDVISRADAIRWVKTECNPYGKPTLDFESGKKVIEHLEKMPSAQRWIPVTLETLPNLNSVVVVCGRKGTWDYGTYRGWYGDIHSWNWKKNTIKHVYWWMYKADALPEPYKGEQDD